jgi:hypothetical protein
MLDKCCGKDSPSFMLTGGFPSSVATQIGKNKEFQPVVTCLNTCCALNVGNQHA